MTDPKATQADVTPNAKTDRKTDAADAAFEHVDQQPSETSHVAEIEQLRAELLESQKRTLVAQAELENFRKRARRDMDEERRYASLPLIRDMLPAIDNLERAVEVDPGQSDDTVLVGVKMVLSQWITVLEQYQCRRVSGVGTLFDPNYHEAVAQQPSEEYEAGTVLQVLQSGYQLHDRVVRPAHVIVSSGMDSPESTA